MVIMLILLFVRRELIQLLLLKPWPMEWSAQELSLSASTIYQNRRLLSVNWCKFWGSNWVPVGRILCIWFKVPWPIVVSVPIFKKCVAKFPWKCKKSNKLFKFVSKIFPNAVEWNTNFNSIEKIILFIYPVIVYIIKSKIYSMIFIINISKSIFGRMALYFSIVC